MALILLAAVSFACDTSYSLAENGRPVFRQRAISDIACGPSAIFNWLSHGGEDLQGVLATLTAGRTPEQTVRHVIASYGARRSATNPAVARYGRHNGGVGSVNLMLMASELVADHLDTPPALRGEYLQRLDGESTDEHLERVATWFSESIDSGVPVLFYIRAYERTASPSRPAMVFGHHVVVTALDRESRSGDGGAGRIEFTFVDSGSGRVDVGELRVAEQEFTAPTFTYRFEGERALTEERLRTGRPVLEVRIRSYEAANPPDETILLAHFATFAEVAKSSRSAGLRPAA